MPFEYNWQLIQTCPNEVVLEICLDSQRDRLVEHSQLEVCQVCHVNRDKHEMRYIIYRCNSSCCKEVAMDQVCAWYMKTLTCQVNSTSTVYEHGTHASIVASPKAGKINLAMERFVKEKTDAGEKPRRILNLMVLHFNMPQIDPRDLLPRVQYIARQHRTTSLTDNDYIDDMTRLAAQHRYRPEMDESTAFTFGFRTGDNGEPKLGDGSDDNPLALGIATKTMIRRLDHASTHMLHLDATYKLTIKGYPLIVVGVSDMWRQFHPVSYFIVSDVKQTQSQRAIEETLCLYEQLIGSPATLRFVMMDADDAQRNAFETVVMQRLDPTKQPVFLMCFFHVMQNVRKHTANMPHPIKMLIYRHVYNIHYARDPTEKQQRVNAAIAAWEDEICCRSFSKYFTVQWLTGRYTRWSCFDSPRGMAKTNNPAETYNRAFKQTVTKKERLRLNTLVLRTLDESTAASILVKPFELTTRISPEAIRDFRRLTKNGALTVVPADRSSITFLTSESEQASRFKVHQRASRPPDPPTQLNRKPSSKGPHDQEERTDRDLDAELQPSVGWDVDVSDHTCGCRVWRKFETCAHLIAARDGLGIPVSAISPTRATFVDKRKKRKRGRPSRAGHALATE
jgi:hypothetical protein